MLELVTFIKSRLSSFKIRDFEVSGDKYAHRPLERDNQHFGFVALSLSRTGVAYYRVFSVVVSVR